MGIKLSQLYESRNRIPEAVVWLEKAMRFLFPNVDDLTMVSPDLICFTVIVFGFKEEKIRTFLSTTNPSGRINFLPITFNPEDNTFGLSLLGVRSSPVPITELFPIVVFLSIIVSQI